MDVLVPIVVGAAFGALGFVFGRRSGRVAGVVEGRREAGAGLGRLVEAVRRGRLPEGASAGSPEAALQRALQEGWAPREAEREAALREAVGRVSLFLDQQVRRPLREAGGASGERELRDGIDRALGALEDLDFFVREAQEVREGADLTALLQRVSREFVSDQSVGVRLALSDAALHARVNPGALMDALYLVLHNAARFGKGTTVDLGLEREDGHAKITVRDHGPGFSEESFRRAFDPFYSTSSDGLGLGLPHARKVVEAMGGRIQLRNVPDGGAEVEISLPID